MTKEEYEKARELVGVETEEWRDVYYTVTGHKITPDRKTPHCLWVRARHDLALENDRLRRKLADVEHDLQQALWANG